MRLGFVMAKSFPASVLAIAQIQTVLDWRSMLRGWVVFNCFQFYPKATGCRVFVERSPAWVATASLKPRNVAFVGSELFRNVFLSKACLSQIGRASCRE